jgi:DNA-binding transcriptional regulator YiaG
MKQTVSVVRLGRVWNFEIEMKEVDGRCCLSAADGYRMSQTIALSIFRKNEVLTNEEFAFLVEVTGVSQKELANVLSRTGAAVSLWKKRNSFPLLESKVLKEYFFSILFERELGTEAKTIEERMRNGVERVEGKCLEVA